MKPPDKSELLKPVCPFLKWPGGKRWVAEHIAQLIRPHLVNSYFEPFLGGGAVFFSLLPASAVLSDINSDLMNTYEAVRDNFAQIIRYLRSMEVSQESYNRIRAWNPSGRFLRAARFLYLNRTAFGGIHRLNRNGQFNVPFGGERLPNALWERQLLKHASTVLRRARLLTADFETMLDEPRKGDVVYCDPTYTVAHENNGFVRYNEANFSWADQERLAFAAQRARRRGACVIVSNAFHKDVRRLYRTASATVLMRPSLVSRDIKGRRSVREYLFFM